MNYELAKKLSDAGFPQECSAPAEVYVDREKGDATVENGFFLRKPTLSELIEACGKEFRGLETGDWPEKDGLVRWYAKTKEDLIVHGATSEEAVAHLWLALQKK